MFLCGIARPPGAGAGAEPRSLTDAADELEAGAMPVAEGVVSVATAGVRLDPARHIDAAARCLSDTETQRAALFFKDADRVRYTLAHAMLRALLARRLAVAPAEITFAAGPNGKPRLAEPAADVAFNLSYGDGMVAIAFARRPVGVDLEAVRDNLAFSEIGGRFFQPDELRYLNSGRDSDAGSGVRDRFFRLWTRKEAVLKALGVGLSGLGEVSVLGDLVDADGAQGGAVRLALRSLPGPPRHALALALETRRRV
ncbi:MAG: 4'-phosphopantetheinyl transferase family protein [Paracoccaceae bacterium]